MGSGEGDGGGEVAAALSDEGGGKEALDGGLGGVGGDETLPVGAKARLVGED